MPAESGLAKRTAPTLYAIILIKLLKGLLFLSLGVAVFCLSDHNLAADYKAFLEYPLVARTLALMRLHTGHRVFTYLAEQIAQLTSANMLWVSAGTMVYSLFSLVEGVGLMFRVSWAGWMAIGESAFFIPIEIYELTRPGKASWGLLLVLGLNVLIVWYLFRNRHRLFRHHHQAA